jgi:hypothetical protein
MFGFGRHVCPGKDLADAGVWLAIATLLAAFRIGKKSDGNGGFIDVKGEYGTGIIWLVIFGCSYRVLISTVCSTAIPSLLPVPLLRVSQPRRCSSIRSMQPTKVGKIVCERDVGRSLSTTG